MEHLSGIDSFLRFVNQALTPWHVENYFLESVHHMNDSSHGFPINVSPLESAPSFERGKKYVVHRNGFTAMVTMPEKEALLERAIIVATHTDSPCLKIKQKGVYQSEGASLVNCEVYGAPILASWIGRELQIAGKVWGINQEGKTDSWILPVKRGLPCIIPHLAIHFDRAVNDQGLMVAKHDGLSPIIALTDQFHSLDAYIAAACPDIKSIRMTDLSVVPQDEAKVTLLNNEALIGPRFDNLTSVWAAFSSFIKSAPRSDGVGLIYLFCNHEEIGSETSEGAYSRIIEDIFDEMLGGHERRGISRAQIRARSSILSCDAAHGFHYTAPDKYDSRHRVCMGKGVALKLNSQQRYSSPPALLARVKESMEKGFIQHQIFTSRNDIPSGMTIGPILSSRLGIDAVDIGIPVVGMHAAIEMASFDDLVSLEKFLSLYCARS